MHLINENRQKTVPVMASPATPAATGNSTFTPWKPESTDVPAGKENPTVPANTAKQESSGASIGMAELMTIGGMGNVWEASLNSQTKSRVGKLALRLQLTAEQKTTLETALTAQGKRQLEMMKKGFELLKNPEQGVKEEMVQDFDYESEEDIIARWAEEHLDDRQKAEFANMEKKRKEDDARDTAQYQLDEIEEVIDVNEEQKEKIFQLFTRRALAGTQDPEAEAAV
ncbi:MAG: hypothetical protein ACKO2G_09780 [Verrucomicrobiales bacterium]